MGPNPVTTQPAAYPMPATVEAVEPEDRFQGYDGAAKLPTMQQFKDKISTKEGWLGNYNFTFLCMPQLPYSTGSRIRKIKPTPFYALEEDMPILPAMIAGLQHALAMLAGLITPPIIFASSLGFSSEQQNQMVAVSLMACGFLSLVQMSRFPIPFTKKKYFIGTGLITVVGTSFATLSTASSIFNILYADGTCPSTMVDGEMVRGECKEAYGYLLGTSCLCSLLEMGMSFCSPKTLKRIFPPIVTGTVVLLIGASLIGSSGFSNWAGGSGTCSTRPDTGIFALCPTIYAPHALKWGDARYIGLGFLSFISIVIIEFVGSPAMKSASIVLGLIIGCIVAGPAGYIDGSSISSARKITFLWVETFPLKVHGPSVLPMLAVYISLAMEATGDITASSEASRQPVDGLLFESRVQGGILADGINGCLSGLAMNAPVSIFAQNNGVISITRCANRFAGYFCAFFIVMFGIFAKISGVFLAIPNPVLGGVTTFLFASVATSGLKVISFCKFTRRDRVILAASLSLGLGNLLITDWAEYIFTYAGPNKALQGFMNSLIIILSTPFLIAGIVASLLNLTLPADTTDVDSKILMAGGVPEEDPALDDEERMSSPPTGTSAKGAGSSQDDIKEA